MAHLVTFFAGLLFSVGLGIAQMTQPSKVVGFLSVFGAWDASLIFVMIGAVSVYYIAHKLTLRQERPVFGKSFSMPTRRDIDRPPVVGALLFGVGWGTAGFCPGLALAASGTGSASVLIFVLAMAIGMYSFAVLDVRFANEPDGGAGLLAPEINGAAAD